MSTRTTTRLVAANDTPGGTTDVQIAFKALAVLLARAELRAQSRAAANTDSPPRKEAQP